MEHYCRYLRNGHYYRLMCWYENYAMLRAKGCVPFVVSGKELDREYTERPGMIFLSSKHETKRPDARSYKYSFRRAGRVKLQE